MAKRVYKEMDCLMCGGAGKQRKPTYKNGKLLGHRDVECYWCSGKGTFKQETPHA